MSTVEKIPSTYVAAEDDAIVSLKPTPLARLYGCVSFNIW